jgi:hypothetical protein
VRYWELGKESKNLVCIPKESLSKSPPKVSCYPLPLIVSSLESISLVAMTTQRIPLGTNLLVRQLPDSRLNASPRLAERVGPVDGVADLGGNFIVQQISASSTGTGVINSFLRVQATGQERGYNTDVTPPPLDDKAGNFTRVLGLSDIPTVTIGGVVYRQFLLDINQSNPFFCL